MEAEPTEDGNRRLFQLDPFVQPPILKAFFELLPVQDIAKYRLLSKLWYTESLSAWRSSATIKLNGWEDDGSGGKTPLGEFIDLLDEGEWDSHPFKKFCLKGWTFEAGVVEKERFVEFAGAHLTSLTVERCSFVGRDNFRKLIYQSFPKLQFLKMDNCKVDNVSYNWDKPTYEEPAFGVHGLKSLDLKLCLPDSMMAVLSHFHKLESLNVEVVANGRNYHQDCLEIIEAIRAQDQTKLPLKKFDVFDVAGLDGHGQSATSSVALVNLHEQLNIPLQRLKIDFHPVEDVDCNFNDVIMDILRGHSSTLMYLGFDADYVDEPALCRSFPFGFQLGNLEQLLIEAPCFTDNLNFLKHAPNLRVLTIRYVCRSMADSDKLFSNSSLLKIEDWTMPSVTELGLLLPLSPCNLRQLMKWMPNVERLDGLKLDNGTFSMICENWRKLKKLADYGSELTDEGVLGREDTHDETDSVPNITKLKYLTAFFTRSSKLTSKSVYGGFLKLPRLGALSLGGGSAEVDDEAKAALKNRRIVFSLQPT